MKKWLNGDVGNKEEKERPNFMTEMPEDECKMLLLHYL